MQNIADLWAKGVANSMNEFETLAGKNKKEYSKSKSDSFDNVKWSIKKIVSESGKDYGIGVYLDSTLLEGLTDNERIAMVKEYIKELGGKSFNVLDQNGKIIDIKIVDGSSFINSKGKRIKANKDISTKYNKTKIKQDAIILINEMIETAEFSESKPSLYSHGWLDNNGKNNWEYYKVHIQEKNNSVWEATLNVTNSANGEKILYDIFPIKKKESGASVKSVASTNNIIRTNSEKSQEKFSLKSIPNNRVLLSNALETVTQNDIERKYIRDYKAQIGMLEEQQEKLKKINEEIGALSFAPGKRDTARLKELTEERIKTQNRINIVYFVAMINSFLISSTVLLSHGI